MEIWAVVVAFVLGVTGAEVRNWWERRSPMWVLSRDTGQHWTLHYNRWRKVICVQLMVSGENEPRFTNDFARKLSWPVPEAIPDDTRYNAQISVRGDRTEIRRNKINRSRY